MKKKKKKKKRKKEEKSELPNKACINFIANFDEES
jgi:hypothetical protein